MSAQGLGSRAIIGAFYQRLEVATGASWISRLAMRFGSDQASETYKWLGSAPALREFVAGRQAKGFKENGITIANKKFEATLAVLLDEIRRDKTGQVMIRVAEMADRAVTHDASLLSTLIANGATGLCYDGQYFFDTDHSEGNSGTQSNSIGFDISDGGGGGVTTAPTARTMQDAILKAVSTILGFKDDQGEPMNELAKEFIVMTGPSLMGPSLAACSMPTIDAGQANVLVGSKDFKIDPVVNPRLSAWTDKFAVFRADGQAKPLILQTEEELSVSALAEGSDEEFKNDQHLYGVKKIGNAGYGYWQHGALCTFAS
jgi:phage major head subunit gpT-like protein